MVNVIRITDGLDCPYCGDKDGLITYHNGGYKIANRNEVLTQLCWGCAKELLRKLIDEIL
jgi:hypothetical protein